MNKRELLEMLDDVSDETEIRIADQPAWPFEYVLSQVVSVNIAEEKCDVCSGSGYDDEEKCENCDGTGVYREEGKEDEVIVYLATGTQIGYLPSPATSELGWGRD